MNNYIDFSFLAQHKSTKMDFPFVLNYHPLKLDMYLWKDTEIRL